jgi:hypothetical protein
VLELQRTAGNAVVASRLQRQLDGDAAIAFTTWIDAQRLTLHEHAADAIVADAVSLDDAKGRALDVASAIGTGKRLKMLKERTAQRGAAASASARPAATVDALAAALTEELQAISTAQMAGGDETALGQAVPRAVRTVADALTTRFPFREHTYVMLGNSPAPIMAWLRDDPRVPPDAAVHLPLGGLSDPQAKSVKELLADPDARARLFAHFKHCLGDPEHLTHTLVVVDFASSGASTRKVVALLQNWQRKQTVLSFAYTYSGSAVDLRKAGGPETAGLPPIEHVHHPTTRAELVFGRMDMDKLLKSVLHLKGPTEAHIREVVEGSEGAVKDRGAHYDRMVELLFSARMRIEREDREGSPASAHWEDAG